MKECEICGKTHHAFYRKQFRKVLCKRHHDHFIRYGKALERSIADENEIVLREDHAELLTHDRKGELKKVVLIDKEDVEKIKGVKWGSDRNLVIARDKESGQPIYLHRFLVECAPGMIVRHINGNHMDNRKKNLMIITRQEHVLLAKKGNSSEKIRGVLWSKEKKKWVVTIKNKNESYFLGYFKNKDDAIRTRLEAEREFYGEYAPQKHLFEQYLSK